MCVFYLIEYFQSAASRAYIVCHNFFIRAIVFVLFVNENMNFVVAEQEPIARALHSYAHRGIGRDNTAEYECFAHIRWVHSCLACDDSALNGAFNNSELNVVFGCRSKGRTYIKCETKQEKNEFSFRLRRATDKLTKIDTTKFAIGG